MKIKRKIGAILSFLITFVFLGNLLSYDVLAADNPYSGGVTNCTWTAWNECYNATGHALPAWGNAGTWYNSARNAGYSTGSTPRANSVAVWTDSTYGHVAWVSNVSGDQIYVKEGGYNGGFHEGWINAYAARNYGTQTLAGFIYIGSGPDISVTWEASSYKAQEIREGKILISKNAVLHGAIMDDVPLIGIDVYNASGNHVKAYSEEPNRSGYDHVFIWYDFQDELGLSISPGTEYQYSIWVQVGSKKYYSDRETVVCPPVYKVTFNSNGGSTASVSEMTIGKNKTIATLPTTTKSGYIFDGWYTSATGGTKLTTSTPITDNVVYYAHWIEEVKFIKTQPSDFTGTTGGTATFKVVAQGRGLKYQWQTNSNGSWVNSSLPGYNTATLSVPITTSRNGYKFRCVVTDSSNKTETSNAATLHAASPVSITTHPKDYTGTVGSTAKFTVVAKGAGLKYQWQTYSNGAWKNSSLTGYNTATLSVPVITSRNGYKFRCVVTDSGNNTYESNAATLHVTAYTAVSITSQPKDYTGNVGTTATFKVVAQGTGLKYQWQTYSNGAWKNSSLTGYNTATLSVPVVASRNGYKFRCVVTDATNKSVTTNAVTLKVVVPTALTITGQPGNYTGNIGSTATFRVVAQGTGLKYQWQTYSNGAWKNSSLPGYNTATLSVPVVASRNGYKFRCVVTDSSNKTATSNTAVLRVAT